MHRNGSETSSTVSVRLYSPVTPLPPLPVSLLSAAEQHPPPYILHLTSEGINRNDQGITVIELLERHSELCENYIRELAMLGAIYTRVGPPHPRKSPRPTRLQEDNLSNPLPIGTPIYVRVHATPKRHFPCTPLTILVRTDDFVAVCKPAGLPVAPSIDNSVECVLAHTAKAIEASVYITTRLDVCTSGVLLFALRPSVVAPLNAAMKEAYKAYLAWTTAPPKIGRLDHWINAANPRRRGTLGQPLVAAWAPVVPSGDAKWVKASLIITQVKRVGELWQSHVVLLTGRTHQIRVQFAAQGWPLLGDEKYIAAANLLHPASPEVVLGKDPVCIGLHAVSLHVKIDDTLREFSAPISLRGATGIPGVEIEQD